MRQLLETRRLEALLVVALLSSPACDHAGRSSVATNASSSPDVPGPAAPAPSVNDGGGAGGRTQEQDMKIRLVIDGEVLTATLVDSAATRDFLALLPLDLTLRDYSKTEKVSDLPSRLSTAGAPAGVDPAPGDITYYAPWGNLAIFYRDFGFASGLVKLGHIDSGIEKLARRHGDFTARFERAGGRLDKPDHEKRGSP